MAYNNRHDSAHYGRENNYGRRTSEGRANVSRNGNSHNNGYNASEEYTDISSYSTNAGRGHNEANGTNKAKRKKIIISVVCIVLALIFGVTGSGFIYVGNLFGKYEYAGGDGYVTEGEEVKPLEPITAEAKKSYDPPDIIDGLYNDDAVLNILLMGVDDYQAGDVGRTDSMMLVSIDRRHNELKVTSFMRDMYVEIPGGYLNRINTAYTVGGANLLVDTIEENFKVDIDRYVQINFEAFVKIIDILGGVDVEISQAEADVINSSSGETSLYAHEGKNTLNGMQARYYARIRKVSNEESNDYGRTLRQRKVFASIVSKFKSSNLRTITNLANEIVPLVKSNLTQEEIYAVVKDSLTYMNYDMKQCRVPSDEMHDSAWVSIDGWDAAVLIPDLAWNTIYVNEFVYGDDFPELRATLDYYGYTPCGEKKKETEDSEY